jgi:hypothetical protein
MIERYFPQANVLLRLRSGPIGPYLPRFGSALEQRQFSRHSICRYIRVADGLCRWLDDQSVALVEANQSHIKQYMQTTEIYLRADPMEKIEAIEAVTPPALRRGRFTVPDKLIASLRGS